MNFEAPLTRLVWLTSFGLDRPHLRRLVPAHPDLGDGSIWWKLSTIITCGTLAGAVIPELVKVFTSTESAHVREVVTSSEEGGASLNILSGFVAGNFCAYWLGMTIMALMAIAYGQHDGAGRHRHDCAGGVRLRPGGVRVPRHGPGDDRGRLLRPGDRQRAVGLRAVHRSSRFRASRPTFSANSASTVDFEKAKQFLEENDGAGQHLQGHGQAGAHRDGGGGRHHHDLLDHHRRSPRGSSRTWWPSSRCCTRPSCWASSPAAR